MKTGTGNMRSASIAPRGSGGLVNPHLGERTIPPRRKRAGFTLVEVMLSLAIMAVIMAAVGAAMHGAFLAYAENNKIAQVTQTARSVLHRMMQEVRTAEAVTSTATSVSVVPPDNAEGLSLIVYELTNGTLFYKRTVNGEVLTEPVVGAGDGVTIQNFTVWRETATDGEGVEYTTRLTARLDISAGANRLDVSAAVCPRRNMTF